MESRDSNGALSRLSGRIFLVIAIAGLSAQTELEPPAVQIGDWGIDVDNVSTTVSPGDDFYQFVNEGWLDTAEIPLGLPRIESFVEATLEAEAGVKEIIRESLLDG